MKALRAVALLAAAALGGCAAPRVIVEGAEAAQAFHRDFSAAVESADRIVLTAHRNVFDVVDDTSGHYVGEPVVVASRELDAAQRTALAEALRRIDRGTRPATMCLFSPHHAIVFHERGTTRAVEVCFTCGDLGWGERPGAYPAGLLDLLRALFADAGLEPDRHWERKTINPRAKAGQNPALRVDDIDSRR